MDILEQAILDIICKRYRSKYVGPLKITELPGGGWDVAICLMNEEKPLHIAAQLEWDDFLKYFDEEIRKRHLHHTHYYTGYQSYMGEYPGPIKRKCIVHLKKN